MRLRLLKANPKKCSACGSPSHRVVDTVLKEKTYFSIKAFEASPDSPEEPRQLAGGMLGTGYSCSKCAHLDFYLTVFSTEETSP